MLLDLPELTLAPGQRIGIAGPSGAGKSTLLALLAGMVQPDRGTLLWGSTDLTRLSESARDTWRRRTVGQIFQDFHLIPELDAGANVLLPLGFDRLRIGADARQAAVAQLAALGIADPLVPVARLSRGEQQRVALARALVRQPQILLADEPTASLDAAAAEQVGDLLCAAAAETKASLIVVSHDRDLLARMERLITLDHGRVVA